VLLASGDARDVLYVESGALSVLSFIYFFLKPQFTLINH